ncbi:MAG: HAD family hydrolase [bacterium]|nr:HAD family hydrolase [bacterium]
MKYKVISFDLQGTLSDDAFSDEFWLEFLPKLYSESRKVSLAEAKEALKNKFKEYGRYDYRYYSVRYWIKELDLKLKFDEIRRQINTKPFLFADTLEIIEELYGKVKLIIISSTTNEFIEAELGDKRKYFDHIYSSLDSFGIAGKPKELYLKIVEILGIKPSEMIHIGNSEESDIRNAKEAGLHTFFLDEKESRERLTAKLKKIIC